MNLSEVLAAMVFTLNSLSPAEGGAGPRGGQSSGVIRTCSQLVVTLLVITFN